MNNGSRVGGGHRRSPVLATHQRRTVRTRLGAVTQHGGSLVEVLLRCCEHNEPRWLSLCLPANTASVLLMFSVLEQKVVQSHRTVLECCQWQKEENAGFLWSSAAVVRLQVSLLPSELIKRHSPTTPVVLLWPAQSPLHELKHEWSLGLGCFQEPCWAGGTFSDSPESFQPLWSLKQYTVLTRWLVSFRN